MNDRRIYTDNAGRRYRTYFTAGQAMDNYAENDPFAMFGPYQVDRLKFQRWLAVNEIEAVYFAGEFAGYEYRKNAIKEGKKEGRK